MENEEPRPTQRDDEGPLGFAFDSIMDLPLQFGGLYVVVGGAWGLGLLIGRDVLGLLVPGYWLTTFCHVLFTIFAPWRHSRRGLYDAARRALLVMATAFGPWLALGGPKGDSLLAENPYLLFPLLVLWSACAAMLAWNQRASRPGWLTWGFSALGAFIGVAGLAYRMMA